MEAFLYMAASLEAIRGNCALCGFTGRSSGIIQDSKVGTSV